MKALVPVGTLSSEYLCAFIWAFNSRFLDLVEKSTHDTRRLETTKLINTQIPVPPAAEQHRIVDKFNALQAEIDDLKRLQNESATELDALLPSVLSRAFTAGL